MWQGSPEVPIQVSGVGIPAFHSVRLWGARAVVGTLRQGPECPCSHGVLLTRGAEWERSGIRVSGLGAAASKGVVIGKGAGEQVCRRVPVCW